MTAREPSARRGRGRPSEPLIRRDTIISAALALVDEGSPVTMRAVAARLGVNAASLYNHTAGIDDIVDGIRDLIAEEVAAGFDAPAGDWRAVLRHAATAYRTALLAHPGVIPLLLSRPLGSLRSMELYEAAADALTAAGWSPTDAVAVTFAVESFVLGSALQAVAPPLEPEPAVPGADDPYPTLRAGGAGTDRHFDLGLDALTAGFGLLLESGGRARDLGEQPRRG